MSENKDLITSYLDTINNRTIEIQREMNKLKYLLDLKKSKSITSTIKSMSEDDKKSYETKIKMYLSKIADGTIKAPKDDTLKYYNIIKDNEEYKIKG